MLTLFAVVGLTFVFYADSEANSARTFREAGGKSRADVDPELALSFFLSQLIGDASDSDGVYSALRGHSLARLMYGLNTDTVNYPNNVPFNGVGRLHTGPATNKNGTPEPGSYNNPFNIDDYYLVNYTYFPADNFLRDPERLGSVAANGNYSPWRQSTNDPVGYYTGGVHAPYTYPDQNNMFLAIVNADGQVVVPSYFRRGDPNTAGTDFGPLDPSNPNWTSGPAYLKYLTLRPRPADHLGFPAPEDAGGDVKNRLDLPGGNDSIWLDLGAPVVTLPDRRKFKALFAPLIVDLDGKVNLNVHGNIKGTNLTHTSNQGWGPWEVNLSKVLTNANEWNQLFLGRTNPTVYGRYGKDGQPNDSGGISPAGRSPHYYSQVDFDGFGTDGGLQLPGFGAQGNFLTAFPFFPTRYANGDVTERTNHPLRYNVLRDYLAFNPTNDDRVFTAADLAALLRSQNTGSEALTSDLLKLSPTNFATAPNAERIRRMVTTHSFDRNAPGVTPYIYVADPQNPPAYGAPATNATGAPQGPPIPFPPLPQRALSAANGEFTADWRALSAALGRVDLNRTLTPYPLYPRVPGSRQTTASYNARFDDPNNSFYADKNPPALPAPTFDSPLAQFLQAQTDRQNLANDIYRRLLVVTGVLPVANPAAPTDAELMPRRWLAQLAANIVDYIDEDDISTLFNFYTAADAGNAAGFDPGAMVAMNTSNNPELNNVPKYWVFGTELPHVVVNEVLAETDNAAIAANPQGTAVKVWIELANPFAANDPTKPLQDQDGFPVQLNMAGVANSLITGQNSPAYSPYRVVVSTGIPTSSNNNVNLNNNVLGQPNNTVRALIGGNNEFVNPAPLIGGGKQQTLVASISPQGSFLLGPPTAAAKGFSDPFVAKSSNPAGAVPDATPVLRLPGLTYNPTFVANATTDERTTGLNVMLRRLANPHLPFNAVASIPEPNNAKQLIANPYYNPYVTVDALDKIPLRDQVAGNTTGPYASRGKRQPYAGLTLTGNNVFTVNANSPVTDQVPAVADALSGVSHTFGLANTPAPFSGHYDWLVHLDRQLISSMELLHVSGYQTYQLTQQFIRGNDLTQPNLKFQHYVPWFDQDLVGANPAQSHRLYRIFELLYTHSWATGVNPPLPASGIDPGLDAPPGLRYPGKININTIWDPEIFAALCDGQPAGNNNPSFFSDADVAAIYKQMIAQRTPNGVPGLTDRPFWGLASGLSVPDRQNPRGRSIEDTLLRSFNGAGGAQRLFQPTIPAVTNAGSHPYAQYQLLTKIYNQLTTRSNVFAVWVTVGFFQVMDDTTRPVKLGPEIGRVENQHIRHRLFAIVDRSVLTSFTGPDTRFNPHEVTGGGQARLVPYFAVID
jgi:hypothetical protein